ncbi:unnamed protein product, partial [Vitis vinifera]
MPPCVCTYQPKPLACHLKGRRGRYLTKKSIKGGCRSVKEENSETKLTRKEIKELLKLQYDSFNVGSLTCSSGWQTPTERGERMAQESTGSERTRGAAAWIIVE